MLYIKQTLLFLVMTFQTVFHNSELYCPAQSSRMSSSVVFVLQICASFHSYVHLHVHVASYFEVVSNWGCPSQKEKAAKTPSCIGDLALSCIKHCNASTHPWITNKSCKEVSETPACCTQCDFQAYLCE